MRITAEASSKNTVRGTHVVLDEAMEEWRVNANANAVNIRFSTRSLSMSGHYTATLQLSAEEISLLAARLNEAQRERIAALEAEISNLRGAGEN